MSIIAWIVLGLIAGWLAGMFMKGGGYGIVGDIVLGILGAILGGWLTGLLLGRDMMGAARAAAGTLLLAGITYYAWATPEFNHNVASLPFWAGFAFVILFTICAVVAPVFKKTRVLGFGLLWFLIALLPTSLLPLAEVMNDHRTFLPYVGLVIAVAATAMVLSRTRGGPGEPPAEGGTRIVEPIRPASNL